MKCAQFFTLEKTMSNLNEIAVQLEAKAKQEAKSYFLQLREEAKARLKKIKTNQPVIQRLVDAGIIRPNSVWDHGSSCSIELGFFPQTSKGNRDLAARVGQIRKLVGARLEIVGKSLGNEEKKHVLFRLCPVGHESISIYFARKLPKKTGGEKCKIVTRRYMTLVCEA